MKSKNFLIEFNEELLGLVKSNKTNPSFLSIKEICAGKNKLELFPKETKDIDDLIDNLLEVLDTMSDIFYKPHIQTTTQEYISRSELVSSINNDDFLKTVKDPSLWKQKGAEMVPEYVYSKEYIDTIDNYDNRFIIFVFKEIINLIKDFTELQLVNANSIKNFYDSGEISLSKLSIYSQVLDDKEELSSFIYKSSRANKNFEKLQKIHKKVTRLKANKFYQTLKDTFIKIPISMTNILLHDRRYNKIYRFYKSFLFSKDDLSDIENIYYNYAATRLLNFIYESDKKQFSTAKIEFNQKTKTIEFKNFEFDLNNQHHVLNSLNDNRILITTNYLDSTMTTLLTTRYVVNKDESVYIDEKYNNNFYIAYNNFSNSSEYIATISHFKNIHPNLELNNIFKSMCMIIDMGNEEAENKCPICGAENLALKHKDIRCLQCRATYSFIEEDGENKVWIKNLWRKEK